MKDEGVTGRRRILAGLVTLVAAALAKLTNAGSAAATTSTTLVGGSTTAIGLAATPGTAGAPVIPTIGTTNHAIIGSNTGVTQVFRGSGVLGARNGAGLAGVYGANGSDGTGVVGTSDSGPGIEGGSNTGHGVVGFSDGTGTAALVGSGTDQAHGLLGFSVNQFGVAGINQAGNNWAGLFVNSLATAPGAGRAGVFVQGNFLVVNGTKSAGVKTDSGYRTLYAVEATENFFEDFGTARLQRGRARVDLDPVFGETVNTQEKYYVFLTPRGDSKGLFVSAQDSQGFSVQEANDGTGSYEFDFRIVAKVRGLEDKRLEQFTLPATPGAPVNTFEQYRRRSPARREGPDD
jgi:hypothetical protein